MPAVSFTQDIRGGEQKLASVGTTWQEVRFPTRTRQVTATFDADGYLGRGQTQGGAVSNHKASVMVRALTSCRAPPPRLFRG